MTAKLVLSLNGSVLREYPLTKERVTIGRKAENDIHVDNLAVSGQHALIITILNDSFLEDLGSTNGTYVNGKLIKKHALQDSDVIGVGKHELKYLNEQASSTESDFEKTMIIRPGMADQSAADVQKATEKAEKAAASAPAEHQGRPAGGKMPLGKIQVLNGPAKGKELTVKKALTTLGRPGVQVAVITRRPQGYFVTHVEGKHPVVNGRTIGSTAHPLKDNDVLELAGVKMEFFVNK
ncbi:MAG: FHA domain-containing protein [Gammaproteobacteria bacterium]|nr:FHA domain-containing protein [Gammaproteobacteria bacterium]